MGIVYDPMTGEPIETPDEETVNENADAVKEEATENSAETVEEVNETVTETAEEVANTTETVANESVFTESVTENATSDTAANASGMNFDPMTGKPINGNDFAQPTPSENNEKKTNKNLLFILAGVAVVAVILLICFLAGAFTSKKTKVTNAVAKTFDYEPQLLKDLTTAAEVIQGKNFTLTYSVEAEETGYFEGSLVMSDGKKQVYADCDIDELVPFTVLAEINDKEIKAEVPEAIDYVFSYNYRDEKDGYIMEELDEDTVEAFDKILQSLYDAKADNNEYVEKINDLNSKYLKELKFENADEEEFKVDGKKVACKGISVTIENDLMVDYFDEFYDIYIEQLEETMKDLPDDIADIDDLKDSLKDAKKELKDVPDIEVTFYIYKKALACIHVDTGKKHEGIDVLFKGGDHFRAQEIAIEVDDEEVLTSKFNIKNDKEVYTISTEDDFEISVSYNTKNGDIVVSYDDYYDSEEFEFNMTVKGDTTTLTFDDIEIPYVDTFNMEFVLSKGTDFKKFENSDVFDIGNADEEDLMDLIDEFDEDFLEEFSYMLY